MSTAVPLLEKNYGNTPRRGLGCVEFSANQKRIKLPLAGVDISASVVDRLAHVTVVETFGNPYKECMEAVYIFPLSGGCVVSTFQMKVGDRVIEGTVNERQAARQEYAQAMLEGRRAALLEQDRDDVFTVQVGNLPPGEEITVTLTYSEKLAYFDQGLTEIRLPLVVAPRYIPGTPVERLSVGDGVELDTDEVPDASRITPPRLAAGVDANVDLKIAVTIAAGETLEDLGCSQHATKVGTKKEGITVTLAREDELLDRDFVVRWRVASDEVQSTYLFHQSGYGMISLIPPAEHDIVLPARDVIFVIDRSGSMMGIKMASAARACGYLLSTLGPSDRFAIQAFDTEFEWMTAKDGSYFISATEAGQEAGHKYLRSIEARGGTELLGSLVNAFDAMAKRPALGTSGRMPVIVVLTDGEVGNESAVFKCIQKELGDSRIFTVGIDTAVNDGILRKAATLGGGTCTFVEPGAQLESALSHVGREIGSALITDITIEDVNSHLDKKSITPCNRCDLFEGRAVTTFFKCSSDKVRDVSQMKLKLKGTYADGKKFETTINAQHTDVRALPQLWARSVVVDLEDEYRVADQKRQIALKKQIVSVAVEHSILTKFTAFVAVDTAEVVNKDGSLRKVVQPVQNPALWEEPAKFGMAGAAGWGAAAGSIGSIGSIGAFGAAPRLRQSIRSNQPAPGLSPPACPAPMQDQCFGQSQSQSNAWGEPEPMTLAESIQRKISENINYQSNTPVSWPATNDKTDNLEATEVGCWGAPMPSTGQADGWGGAAGSEMPAAPPPPPAPPAAPAEAPASQASPAPGQPAISPAKSAQPPQQAHGFLRQLFGQPISDSIMDKIFNENLGLRPKESQAVSVPALRRAEAEAKREEMDQLNIAFRVFMNILKACLSDISIGAFPQFEALDQARLILLRRLTTSPLADKLPLLQKYLRADILHLLAALVTIEATGIVNHRLKEIGRQHSKKLQLLIDEFQDGIECDESAFWGATV